MSTINKGGISIHDSSSIKAIALIMMIYHHFLGFPNRVLISNPYFEIILNGSSVQGIIAGMCKLCVCLFAFLTGYGLNYSFRKMNFNERLHKCISKISNLVLIYWLTLLCVLFPCAALFGKHIDIVEIIKNVFLLDSNLLHTSWYIIFYIEVLLLVAICFKIFTHSFISLLGVGGILLYVIGVALGDEIFLHYFPSVILGLIFARYEIYEYIYRKIPKNILIIIGGIILCAECYIKLKIGDSIGPISTVTFIAPIMVYELKLVLEMLETLIPIDKILGFISKYSMYYWLIHAVFHCGIKELQVLGYVPQIPFLIVIWVICIMTPVAIGMKTLSQTIMNYMRNRGGLE